MYSVYEVLINSDLTEGRGNDYVCARFFTVDAAKEFAKGRDVMGTDGKVRTGLIVEVSTQFGPKYYPVGPEVLVFESVEDKARTEALNKLTPAERKLLGLS